MSTLESSWVCVQEITGRYVEGLALTAAANVCSEAMARDIFADVLQKMSSSNPFIKKKACLCMINVLNKVPDMVEDMVKTLPTLLADEDHGVLISGTCPFSLL